MDEVQNRRIGPYSSLVSSIVSFPALSIFFGLLWCSQAAGLHIRPHMANSATSARVTRQFVFSRSSPEGIKLTNKPAVTLSKDLDKVLLRVVCAGINPVDAKGLVGDKFPGWMNSVGAYKFLYISRNISSYMRTRCIMYAKNK